MNQKPFKEARSSGASHYVSRAQGNLVLVDAAIAGLAATELVSACAVPAITVEMSLLASLVIFSAMTTATAFGILWFSSHPGTSSMGKLLALSLVTTPAAAVLFQPTLMGPPRQEAST